MRECRDAEAVARDDARLGAQERERAEPRVDRGGAEGAGELAESVREEIVERGRGLHVVLVRGDLPALGRGTGPQPVELRGLLLAGHRGEQGLDAGGALGGEPGARGGTGPGPGRGRGGGGLGGHAGGHFPPMPISPWMRARRANRYTSRTGRVERTTAASSPGMFTPYWVWKL
ncbi:hypothetical protein GA0115252_158918 [Streptomyces sp. DfronAA-171]|nr:hypothetical protein GA0115252_158918 [Streptomyces sp. DfronAA-171]